MVEVMEGKEKYEGGVMRKKKVEMWILVLELREEEGELELWPETGSCCQPGTLPE